MQRKRSIQKKFYVNELENNYLKTKMVQAKIDNFSVYARLMLLNGEINVLDFEQIKQVRIEVNRIGVNINQVVKKIHETVGSVSKEDVQQLLNLQHLLVEQVNQILYKTLET